jgi:hypothetical protein
MRAPGFFTRLATLYLVKGGEREEMSHSRIGKSLVTEGGHRTYAWSPSRS